MMRRSSESDGGSSRGSAATAEEALAAAATAVGAVEAWEMRPGGMLVQRRAPEAGAPPPTVVRVRIARGAVRYEVSVSSIATFGELKKLLAAETGLRPVEQKLLYRGKERSDNEFLDVCGVKNKSKILLIEDATNLERRYNEMKKNARIQGMRRAICAVSMEVDKLGDEVTRIGESIASGSKVAELQITTLIELLMRQAVELDSITTEGDASSQKNLQVKRVQKYVETLDVLKISNARLKPVFVMTKWETFDPPATTQWEYFD